MTQEALKLALEALEWCHGGEPCGTAKAITAIKKALAQRTEPPDWSPAVENILKEYGLQAIDFVADFKEAMKDAEQSQRTWVGLTVKEVNDLYDSDYSAFHQRIEAKLKQKNG